MATHPLSHQALAGPTGPRELGLQPYMLKHVGEAPPPWEELLGGALAAKIFLKLAQNLFCNPGWMRAQFSLVAGQQLLLAATAVPSAVKEWRARAEFNSNMNGAEF